MASYRAAISCHDLPVENAMYGKFGTSEGRFPSNFLRGASGPQSHSNCVFPSDEERRIAESGIARAMVLSATLDGASIERRNLWIGMPSLMAMRRTSPASKSGEVSRTMISYSTTAPGFIAGSGARATRRSEKMFASYSVDGESPMVLGSSQ